MARILVVDDEANMRKILSALLTRNGHEVGQAGRVQEAREALANEAWDLVLADQRMPDGAGMDLMRGMQELGTTVPVILVTAYGTVDLAVEAMRNGAFDFVTKPFEPDSLLASIDRALDHGQLIRENLRLKDEVKRLAGSDHIIGDAPAMRRLRQLIARVAATDSTVLITGETGTGKELVARAIHQSSRRSNKTFVAVNCAAMPETLLDNQLFGHERGAFTGADKAQAGLFEAADGGTLFLDEAGEMTLALQAKLLRILVDQEVLRIGATAPRKVNVRILVATHRDLEDRVRQGIFRDDLYFRLAVIPLHVPALRDRKEDIPALVASFLRAAAHELKTPERTLAPDALAKLMAYGYPGNVRELRNLIERACILGAERTLRVEDFWIPSLQGDAARAPSNGGAAAPAWVDALPEEIDMRNALEQAERDMIVRALRLTSGAQAEAARKLGISRSDLAYKLKKYELRPEA